MILLLLDENEKLLGGGGLDTLRFQSDMEHTQENPHPEAVVLVKLFLLRSKEFIGLYSLIWSGEM